ncbi:MAG: hypothetical protein JXQ71_17120 [Verrucomicrobia bacterium]|nr:hypothetical protein [Verrucomicrobiota bacterium]
MNRALTFAFVPLLLLAAAAGCARRAAAPRSSPAGEAIDRINLICRPVALDFDKHPGPDGIGVTLYASSLTAPKTVRIPTGTLHVLLWDGVFKPGDLAATAPFRTWTYTAAELKRLSFTSSIGICYPLALQWGDTKPSQLRVTVLARYLVPDGAVIQSPPGIISMTQ